jgi:hypothetical protein
MTGLDCSLFTFYCYKDKTEKAIIKDIYLLFSSEYFSSFIIPAAGKAEYFIWFGFVTTPGISLPGTLLSAFPLLGFKGSSTYTVY